MSNIIGKWQSFVDWNNTGTPYPAGVFTFKSDGTWSYGFGGGTWVESGSIITFNFDNSPGLFYSGTVNSIAAMGGMGYVDGSGDNSFYLLPEGTKHVSISEAMLQKEDRNIK